MGGTGNARYISNDYLISSCAVGMGVGGVDIRVMGVLEKQQHHIRQKRRTNVPNPKEEPVIVLCIPIFIFWGYQNGRHKILYQMMNSIPPLQSALTSFSRLLTVKFF